MEHFSDGVQLKFQWLKGNRNSNGRPVCRPSRKGTANTQIAWLRATLILRTSIMLRWETQLQFIKMPQTYVARTAARTHVPWSSIVWLPKTTKAIEWPNLRLSDHGLHNCYASAWSHHWLQSWKHSEHSNSMATWNSQTQDPDLVKVEVCELENHVSLESAKVQHHPQ